MTLNENLFYSLSDSGELLFVDENFQDKIIVSHFIVIKVFEENNSIRIETIEKAVIDTESYYHKYIKTNFEKKINYVFDVFLPVIYERKIEFS